MPNIQDATVVNSAYDTSGNGGRKLVKLSNEWLVCATTYNYIVYLYVSKDNGATFQQLCWVSNGFNTPIRFALVSHGDVVYLLQSSAYSSQTVCVVNKIDVTTQTNKNIAGLQQSQPESTGTQTALGECSLAINQQGTELHACWSSKNSTYINGFNIRYAKGTINAEGSVSWGSVVQVTTLNASNYDVKNPSIVVNKNNNQVITCELGNSADSAYKRAIICLHKENTTKTVTSATGMGTDSSWGNCFVYDGITYLQSNPSAIFVPQSVNGLANGRIWVAWHGRDATETMAFNIRVAYSDDGGVTWSTMNKISTGNSFSQEQPSITVNDSNKVFILWWGATATSVGQFQIRMSTFDGSTWSTPTSLTTNTAKDIKYPSTLLDFNLTFSSPLFVCTDVQNSKVGFYGNWTVTTISVTEGFIGEKTDKGNVLTYTITTDGTMSTITEKINGATIKTRTATSGQSLIVGLTQAQWDAIKFGKYADATGGLNTLTVEMGTKKWTYTFDKRVASGADVEQAMKAVQDSGDIFLPAIKNMLIEKVGGNTTDTFENIVKNGAYGKKWASGTVTTTGSSITVSGLSFKPSLIIVKRVTSADYHSDFVVYAKLSDTVSLNMRSVYNTTSFVAGNLTVTSSGFTSSTPTTDTYIWLAIE